MFSNSVLSMVISWQVIFFRARAFWSDFFLMAVKIRKCALWIAFLAVIKKSIISLKRYQVPSEPLYKKTNLLSKFNCSLNFLSGLPSLLNFAVSTQQVITEIFLCFIALCVKR